MTKCRAGFASRDLLRKTIAFFIIHFNSTKSFPHVSELESFENKILEMIKNVQFEKVHCKFQKKISTDVKTIKNTKSMFVPADKTNNFYKMDAELYNTLLQKNVTN